VEKARRLVEQASGSGLRLGAVGGRTGTPARHEQAEEPDGQECPSYNLNAAVTAEVRSSRGSLTEMDSKPNVASEAADPCCAWHAQFIDQLARQGYIKNARLLAAFRAVPRHLFLPDIPPAEAYRDVWIPTAQRDGATASSSSRPSFMPVMLNQLDVRPGQRVLEIGAGTAYNAALLSHLAGPTGAVVSIDVDPEIVLAAQDNLQRAGYVAGVASQAGSLRHAEVASQAGSLRHAQLTWFRKDGVSPIGLV